MVANASVLRIGVLWRGESDGDVPDPESSRFSQIFRALNALAVEAAPIVFTDETATAARARLLELDGVLVWVNPQTGETDRTALDAVLGEVASHGVWVSAHPETIRKMGTKRVLVDTRELPWGSETHLFESAADLRGALPALLASGPRVLKRDRGNGGTGVWKLERRTGAVAGHSMPVWVQHAAPGSEREALTLGEFVDRCEPYFERGGCVIDQPYQPRLGEGMTRAYLSRDRVVGFGHQLVTALLPPPPGANAAPAPSPRLYRGPDDPEFRELKDLLEQSWVGEMQRVLGIETVDLPAIWDADFLLGPWTSDGGDAYVLCEINVSSVFPIPDEAVAPLAATARDAALAARAARQPRPTEAEPAL